VATCTGCGSRELGDGYCDHCGLRQPVGSDHVETETSTAAGVSDRGLRHSHNEDAMAMADAGDLVAAVVCDGVSSSSRPEDASRAAADTGVATLVELLAAGQSPEEATLTAAHRAGAAVAGLEGAVPGAPKRGPGGGTQRVMPPGAQVSSEPPSCTYVSAVVGASSVTVGWIGDSRAYWLPTAGEGKRLTDDDSWAEQMVAAGVMSDADAQAHPNAHVITAWMGADADELDPHVSTFTPDRPGVILVCSDGLWNYCPEAADLLAAAPGAASEPLETARSLTRLAIDAGGRDNITVVVIPFPAHAHPKMEKAE
jgi:serine/threonine protein phosphatase PrpC